LKTRVVFMGSDPIALPALEFLAGEVEGAIEFAGVFTQPDRPSGRGKKLKANGIKEWALARDLPVHQPERLGEGEVELLRRSGGEFILVMAYGHILRKAVLELPRLGIWNLHASLLPKYRGASPIQAALACGETETGVTLMRMVRRLDAGPMVDREAFPVERLETGATAEEKMAAACVPLLRRNLGALLRGEANATEQNENEASYCRKLEKSDGAIDFSAPAGTLARRINALFPWPGSSFDFRGQQIKVGLADGVKEPVAAPPGTVLGGAGDGLTVATGEGSIRLLRLQRPGGKMLGTSEFLRGFGILPGTVLPSAPMPDLVSDEPFRAR
jgi:methionyl-tRNA formyltransferase